MENPTKLNTGLTNPTIYNNDQMLQLSLHDHSIISYDNGTEYQRNNNLDQSLKTVDLDIKRKKASQVKYLIDSKKDGGDSSVANR